MYYFCRIMKYKKAAIQHKLSNGKQILFSVITMFIGLFVVCGVVEIIFRLNPKWVADPPAPVPHNYRVLDSIYGWHVQEGYHYQGRLRDKCDSSYAVNISFGKNGFRRWGNPAVTDKKKVLFLGDSYTAAVQTGDDHLFYKIIGDSLPLEIFAFGAAGFGSTQQAMFLEKYINEVKPDIVVWQFCSNDFIDNYWELEKAAIYRIRMKRPYTLEDGSIVYYWKEEYPRTVRPYSYFLYFILKRIAKITGTFDQTPKKPAEKFIADQGLDYPLFAKSVKMTNAVIKKVKAILPAQTKLIAFDADNYNPQYDQFKHLCSENNIPFVHNLADAISNAQTAGLCVHSNDGYHWNDQGNVIVANYLINYFRTHK